MITWKQQYVYIRRAISRVLGTTNGRIMLR